MSTIGMRAVVLLSAATRAEKCDLSNAITIGVRLQAELSKSSGKKMPPIVIGAIAPPLTSRWTVSLMIITGRRSTYDQARRVPLPRIDIVRSLIVAMPIENLLPLRFPLVFSQHQI